MIFNKIASNEEFIQRRNKQKSRNVPNMIYSETI